MLFVDTVVGSKDECLCHTFIYDFLLNSSDLSTEVEKLTD